jgi:hypothetical protein
MAFCQYKHIFGVPGEGVHSMRFMDVALFDYIGTILLAVLTTWATKVPLVITTIFWFVLGIVLHALFCVPTQATIFLGLSL